MPRLPSERSVLGLSGLLGLAAAIWFVHDSSSHFMDIALTFILMFVGTSFIAALLILSALVLYGIVVKTFSSNN
ncbi:MAG: hypothetical protein OXL36_18025 [Bryobacterales bacterium]|nr:hypothetical protein [Bryobacterales bacterium]MDE0293131.1 hypothetical protein [Bryobacterales bacterium]